MAWRKLSISLSELCIDTTLRCGQSFRWRKSADDVWSCALHGRLISLRQDPSYLYYRVQRPLSSRYMLTPPASIPDDEDAVDSKDALADDTEAFLRHYLNLEPNLSQLYDQWSTADSNFSKKAPKFTGVRILRQDAWEALVGFICSSNNNIARISQMMEKLCVHYGSHVGDIGETRFYDMPSPQALSDAKVEAHLRELGFGYRAKYLYKTALEISERPAGLQWLDGLRNPESPVFGHKAVDGGEMRPEGRDGYRMAHDELLGLHGVGPKVADCVCLMGLGWGEAVPVDTHVWQIAVRDYGFGKGKNSSLTKATYDAVGNKFRKLWGKEAGWAHSVLFTADLRKFAERLAAKIEVKEEVIKTEDATIIKVESTVVEKAVVPRVKRKGSPTHDLLLEESRTTRATSSKRKRRG